MVDVAYGSTELAGRGFEARIVCGKALDGVVALIKADGVQEMVAQGASLRGAAGAALRQERMQAPIAL